MVVDSNGKPLAGVGVYVGTDTQQRVAITGADGTFELPCPNSPVLLAAGDYGTAAGNAAQPGLNQGNHAYTFVGGALKLRDAHAPQCTSDTSAPYITSTMVIGGSIHVTVVDGTGNEISDAKPPAVQCPASPSYPCYLPDGTGQATYTGLPPGDYTLVDSTGTTQDVHVRAGETTEVEWTQGGTSTPSPTPSASPSNSATDTPAT